ncbi:MAG: hypothetical protein VCC20_08255 [Myxococcota bacterium]
MANSGSGLASGDVSRPGGAHSPIESEVATAKKRRGSGEQAYLAALALLALAAGGTLWFASQWGIGVSPDSVNYLKSAEKLLAGQGILSLNAHWPPGYPALLAIASAFGSDLLQTTRLLHASLYAANVLLFASLAAPRTSRGRYFAFGGALFFAASTLEVHFMAWSESPFVGLQLASTLLLARRLSGGGSIGLWSSALLAGLSVMVRFAGFPFVATASLAIHVLDDGPMRARLRRALAYAAIGCGPALGYLLANGWAQAGLHGRQFFFELPGADKWSPLLPDLLDWFGPESAWLGAFLGLASVLVIAQRLRVGRAAARLSQREAAFRVALVYLPAYALFILAYMTFLDGWFRSGRILFPGLVFFTVALVVAGVGFADRGGRATTWASGVLLAVLVACSVHAADLRVRSLASEGYGQLDRSARALPILEALRRVELPLIYGNGPDLIYLHLGAASRMLPRHTLPETGRPNPAYAAEMRRLVEEVERGDAVIVIFSRFLWRTYLPPPTALEEQHGMKAAYRARDGIVYTARGRPLRRVARSGNAGGSSQSD